MEYNKKGISIGVIVSIIIVGIIVIVTSSTISEVAQLSSNRTVR